MLVTLSACALAFVVPARWPTSSTHLSSVMLESIDGKFARSQQRDAANSAFCGMHSVQTTTPAPKPQPRPEVESSDGNFARSQNRDGMNSIETVQDTAAASSGTMTGKVVPTGSPADLNVERFEWQLNDKFARSQQRVAASMANCGMYVCE